MKTQKTYRMRWIEQADLWLSLILLDVKLSIVAPSAPSLARYESCLDRAFEIDSVLDLEVL